MKFKKLDHYFTGIAVPVAALKTVESCGTGEYPDLTILGEWCKKTGLEVIQILPVNDTGFQSSPYSALSAFALHPVYARIQAIPEFNKRREFKEALDTIKKEYEQKERIPFYDIVNAKLNLLHKIYEESINDILANERLKSWIDNNQWIKPYAVYNLLKKKNNNKHWKEWPEMINPDKNDVKNYWNEHKDASYFHGWLQFRLEEQLALASRALEEKGICLKGDIPIMMNEDSADVWYNRQYFDTSMNAGAPPDMFSDEGQNWGFPVYKWDILKKDDYLWWQGRLKQADKFYHAYRIDHVLGFFRIWQIPATDNTGILGYFNPYKFITTKQLEGMGFDEGRIRWLSQSHIHGWDINLKNQDNVRRLKTKYLRQIGDEDLYNIDKKIKGETDILALEEDEELKLFLLYWHRNKTLLKVGKEKYHRQWKFPETKAFKSFNFKEKLQLEELFKENEIKSEKIWEKQGKSLLSMMQETTDMLMCAEDLGVVSQCVPKVLKKLNILSLKIERWTRAYNSPGQPYIDVKKYPLLSVCTPSVHDTTTLRGWWEEDLSEHQRKEYFSLLKAGKESPSAFTRKLAEKIIKRNLGSSSILTIFQLQDILFLNEDIDMEVFNNDRVNVPGTITENNWTYRLPVLIEDLIQGDSFNKILKTLIMKRREKKMKAAK